jgi:F0F1-type ATP synthase epsilon subunit
MLSSHGEEHVADEDIEIIADTDIIETELTPEEIEANNKANEDKSRKMS